MWTWDAWSKWQTRLGEAWETLRDAWEDTVRAYTPTVERDPEEAARRAREMHETLFSQDPANPGIWYHIGAIWSAEASLSPGDLAVVRRRMAEELGLPVTEVTGDAMAAAAETLTLGFLKDCRMPSEQPGAVPVLIIAGLVIGLGALCWATVRLEEAQVEHERIALASRMLDEKVAAAKGGYTLDLRDVSKVSAPPPAPSTSGSGWGAAAAALGLVAVVGLGAAVWWRR